MKRHPVIITVLGLLMAGAAFAQGNALPPVSDNAPIYGAQLMSPQERIEHRARMRAASTLQEREEIRAEHHARMLERAREQGVSLPDTVPARGHMMMSTGGGYRGGR